MVPPPLASPLRLTSFLGVDSVPVPRRTEEAMRKMFNDPDDVCTSNYLVKNKLSLCQKGNYMYNHLTDAGTTNRKGVEDYVDPLPRR